MENANPSVDSLKNKGKLPVNYLTKEKAEVWSDTIKVQCQNCRKREEEGQ